jgi:hypothetical protein
MIIAAMTIAQGSIQVFVPGPSNGVDMKLTQNHPSAESCCRGRQARPSVRTDEERPCGPDAVARTCHPRAGSLGHALDREELGSAKLIAVELVITRGPGRADTDDGPPEDQADRRARGSGAPVATFRWSDLPRCRTSWRSLPTDRGRKAE